MKGVCGVFVRMIRWFPRVIRTVEVRIDLGPLGVRTHALVRDLYDQ